MKIIKTSLLAALLFCGTFSAEDAAGIISGKVKKNGAPLEGINIAALDTKKNTVSEALSDTEGKYELKELKPGLYTVKALPATETKLANQESIYTNVLAGKTTEVNFSLRNLKEETLVFPKGFDEKNTNQNLSFVKMVQLTVNDNKTTNEVKTGLRMHYPVGPAQGEAAEVLLKFDLSVLPAGAQILSAKLSLYCDSHYAGTNSISFHRVLVPWTEKANWTTYDGTQVWQKEGGTGKKDINLSYESSLVDIFASKDKVAQWFEWDLTAMFQRWVSKEVPNNGMKSRTAKTASICSFNSPVWNGTNFLKLTVVVGK